MHFTSTKKSLSERPNQINKAFNSISSLNSSLVGIINTMKSVISDESPCKFASEEVETKEDILSIKNNSSNENCIYGEQKTNLSSTNTGERNVSGGSVNKMIHFQTCPTKNSASKDNSKKRKTYSVIHKCPYDCCGKEFKEKGNLRNHLRSHVRLKLIFLKIILFF